MTASGCRGCVVVASTGSSTTSAARARSSSSTSSSPSTSRRPVRATTSPTRSTTARSAPPCWPGSRASRHDLIERLAELVAQDALGHASVDEVTVTVHKPQAPVGVPFGDVTVAVTRRRAAGAGGRGRRGEPAARGAAPARHRARRRRRARRSTPTSPSWPCPALHDTEPVGGPEQPTYVNAVVTARTSLSPTSLLRALHGIEAAFDRRREVRWGARTLDLDLVQYGDPASDGRRHRRPATADAAAPAGPRARVRAACRGSRPTPPRCCATRGGRCRSPTWSPGSTRPACALARPTPPARPPTEDTRTDAAQRDPREDPRAWSRPSPGIIGFAIFAMITRSGSLVPRPSLLSGVLLVVMGGLVLWLARPVRRYLAGARDDLARPAAGRPHRGAGAGRGAHRVGRCGVVPRPARGRAHRPLARGEPGPAAAARGARRRGGGPRGRRSRGPALVPHRPARRGRRRSTRPRGAT